MDAWRRHVVPRMVNLLCNTKATREIRERVCGRLTGEVVELGFGSGLNAPYYPAAVTTVHAVEPSDTGWRLAAKRVDASPVPIRRVGLDGQALPLEDDSVDDALSTWTLCTIPDAVAALREVRRVLRPGGRLHFVEHGLSPERAVARWQHRLDPVQQRLGGGCHLSRPIADLVEAAGFRLEQLDNAYEKGAPKPIGYLYEGVAAPA
jgi:ubiquinone/menaquinone biosynthesis C-methylase UbiE